MAVILDQQLTEPRQNLLNIDTCIPRDIRFFPAQLPIFYSCTTPVVK